MYRWDLHLHAIPRVRLDEVKIHVSRAVRATESPLQRRVCRANPRPQLHHRAQLHHHQQRPRVAQVEKITTRLPDRFPRHLVPAGEGSRPRRKAPPGVRADGRVRDPLAEGGGGLLGSSVLGEAGPSDSVFDVDPVRPAVSIQHAVVHRRRVRQERVSAVSEPDDLQAGVGSRDGQVLEGERRGALPGVSHGQIAVH